MTFVSNWSLHYPENEVEVVDFTNAQGLVKLLDFSDSKGTGSVTMIRPLPSYKGQ